MLVHVVCRAVSGARPSPRIQLHEKREHPRLVLLARLAARQLLHPSLRVRCEARGHEPRKDAVRRAHGGLRMPGPVTRNQSLLHRPGQAHRLTEPTRNALWDTLTFALSRLPLQRRRNAGRERGAEASSHRGAPQDVGPCSAADGAAGHCLDAVEVVCGRALQDRDENIMREVVQEQRRQVQLEGAHGAARQDCVWEAARVTPLMISSKLTQTLANFSRKTKFQKICKGKPFQRKKPGPKKNKKENSWKRPSAQGSRVGVEWPA